MSVRLQGRGARRGIAEGPALIADCTISGWDGFDMTTGMVSEIGHPLAGHSVKGKVLIIRGARGSTGWGTQFLKLRLAGFAPAALVIPRIDSRTAAAAVAARVPLLTDFDDTIFEQIRTGDWVRVDGDTGILEVIDRE